MHSNRVFLYFLIIKFLTGNQNLREESNPTPVLTGYVNRSTHAKYRLATDRKSALN